MLRDLHAEPGVHPFHPPIPAQTAAGPAPEGPVAASRRPDPALSRIGTLLLCTAMWLLLATRVVAQGFGTAAQSRQGFWMGAGLGQGYTDLACGICGGERETGGLSGYLRAGGTVSEKLLIGGEFTAWRRSQEDLGELLGTLSASAWWYPKPQHGWYLKLGAGLARFRASESEDEEHLVSQNFALLVGSGYEMRVNPVLSIVPYVNLAATPSGNLNREITRDGGYSASRVASDARLLVIQVGIGVTRH